MTRTHQEDTSNTEEASLARRTALRRLGLALAVGYAAPTLMTLSEARASGGGSGGGGGGSGGGGGRGGSGGSGGSGP